MKRVGECKRCGACCYLLKPNCAKRNLSRLPDGTFFCKIYKRRPLECRTFPAPDNSKALKAIAEVGGCGYEWVDDEKEEMTYEENGKLYRFRK